MPEQRNICRFATEQFRHIERNRFGIHIVAFAENAGPVGKSIFAESIGPQNQFFHRCQAGFEGKFAGAHHGSSQLHPVLEAFQNAANGVFVAPLGNKGSQFILGNRKNLAFAGGITPEREGGCVGFVSIVGRKTKHGFQRFAGEYFVNGRSANLPG